MTVTSWQGRQPQKIRQINAKARPNVSKGTWKISKGKLDVSKGKNENSKGKLNVC